MQQIPTGVQGLTPSQPTANPSPTTQTQGVQTPSTTVSTPTSNPKAFQTAQTSPQPLDNPEVLSQTIDTTPSQVMQSQETELAQHDISLDSIANPTLPDGVKSALPHFLKDFPLQSGNAAQWKNATAGTLTESRSDSLKRIDAAYQRWDTVKVNGTPEQRIEALNDLIKLCGSNNYKPHPGASKATADKQHAAVVQLFSLSQFALGCEMLQQLKPFNTTEITRLKGLDLPELETAIVDRSKAIAYLTRNSKALSPESRAKIPGLEDLMQDVEHQSLQLAEIVIDKVIQDKKPTTDFDRYADVFNFCSTHKNKGGILSDFASNILELHEERTDALRIAKAREIVGPGIEQVQGDAAKAQFIFKQFMGHFQDANHGFRYASSGIPAAQKIGGPLLGTAIGDCGTISKALVKAFEAYGFKGKVVDFGQSNYITQPMHPAFITPDHPGNVEAPDDKARYVFKTHFVAEIEGLGIFDATAGVHADSLTALQDATMDGGGALIELDNGDVRHTPDGTIWLKQVKDGFEVMTLAAIAPYEKQEAEARAKAALTTSS